MTKSLVVLLVAAVALASARRSVMPWMCLERCDNQTRADVFSNAAHVNALFSQRLVDRVSFERFNLGPNSSLVLNEDLTDVAPLLHEGLLKLPMVSSFPYPPQFLSWMREVFARPRPFFDALVEAARRYGYDGYNIDWEPVSKASEEDALAYSRFLGALRAQLEAQGLVLTVDFASWNRIWDWPSLRASGVTPCLMSTYTGNNTSWERVFTKAVTLFGPERVVVGLQTIDPNTQGPLSHTQLQWRFDHLRQAGVQNIAVWRVPIPQPWMPYLTSYVNSP